MKPEDRLRDLDLIDPPDQWADIMGRRPRLEPPGHRGARAATIALALAVAAAGIGLAAAAFLWESEPTPPPRLGNVPSSSPGASPAPLPQRNPTHSDSWGDPQALNLTCRDGRTVIKSLRVPAQPDGVHILNRNPGGIAGALSIRVRGGEGPVDSYGISLQSGLNRILLSLPPGPVYVRCDGKGFGQDRAQVDVTDPHGFWVSDQLRCDDSQPYDRSNDRMPRPDPFTAIRMDVRGVTAGDGVVRAGYPQDPWPTATMLVIRDGEAVAVNVVVYIWSEGWIVGPGTACPGAGIGGR